MDREDSIIIERLKQSSRNKDKEIERLRKENEIQSQDFKEVHSCVKKLIDMIDRLRDEKKQLKIEIEALKNK